MTKMRKVAHIAKISSTIGVQLVHVKLFVHVGRRQFVVNVHEQRQHAHEQAGQADDRSLAPRHPAGRADQIGWLRFGDAGHGVLSDC